MQKLLVLGCIATGVFFSLASATAVDPATDADITRGDASTHSFVDSGGGTPDHIYVPNDLGTANPDTQVVVESDAAITYDAAGTGTCTLDDIFFDSTNVCATGFFCSVNESYQPACLADARSSGGTFYGACGANGECPVGSLCSGPSAAEATCAPFCSDAHTNCPDDGACVFTVTGAEHIKMCGASDTCDPVANTGCATGDCYITGPDSLMCIQGGTATEGQPCVYLNDCAPQLLCAGQSGSQTCMPLCALNGTDCDTGETCQNVGLPSHGVCS